MRWEPKAGHVQLSTLFRSIGANHTSMGGQNVFGYGLGLSAVFNVTDADTLLTWLVYGKGIGGQGNDTSFLNTNAAFSSDGQLEALDYASALGAITHKWSPRWRSTATFGYANLQNAGGQAHGAYDFSYYTSGNTGDDLRFQLGVVYSVFD